MTSQPPLPPQAPFRAKLALFGLGRYFLDCQEELILALGRQPDFLCDNAEAKWGKTVGEWTCCPPASLVPWREELTVVITARRFEAIADQLRNMGIRDIRIACFDRGYDRIRAIKPLQYFGKAVMDSLELPSALAGRRAWALVTGGTRGIGFEIAKAMAALGINLLLHGKRPRPHQGAMESLQGLGVEVALLSGDFGDNHEIDALLATLDGLPHGVDILFNNAGISLNATSAWAAPADLYLQHFQINTLAPIRLASHLIPKMIARGFGRVINITSTIQRQPEALPYACSKAALDKYVYDVSPTLHDTGVAMSLVCPGHVQSDMGGPLAPHALETVVPGTLLGALLGPGVNGKHLQAQDYAGLSLSQALQKARIYLGIEGNL